MSKKKYNTMNLINQTLTMSFTAIIAASTVAFPIIYLAQKKKQHKELIETLQDTKEDNIE